MLKDIIEECQGWCTIQKAERLHRLIIESNSQLTVELGVFGGRSLAAFAKAHKEKNSGVVFGIDAWKAHVAIEGTNSPLNDEYWRNVNYTEIYNSCQNMIVKNSFDGICETIRMKSQQAAILFQDNSIDILHQDSGHNVETITEELKLWSPKVKNGGYWIADDTNWIEAVEGYSQLPKYGFELVEDYTEWQIWKKVK